MHFCNRLFYYILVISFCSCHDLHHVDSIKVKQSESTVPSEINKSVDVQSTTITTTPTPISDTQQTTVTNTVASVTSTVNTVRPVETITSATIVQNEPKVSTHPRNIQTEDLNKHPTTSKPISEIPEITVTNTVSPVPSTVNTVRPVETTTSATQLQNEPTISVHPRIIQTEDLTTQTATTTTPISEIPQTTMINTVSSVTPTMNTVKLTEATTTTETVVQTEKKVPVNPRIIQTEDLTKQTTITTTTAATIINPKLILKSDEVSIKKDDPNKTNSENVTISLPISISNATSKNRQICWHLPKLFEPSVQLLENQILRFINLLPDFLQTIFFSRIDDRELLLNTMWFGSICTLCGLFSFLFLSMGTKRLKQTKQEKEIRVRCQQLQQFNNQVELERAVIDRQNLKLSEQVDELKALTVRDSDEEIYALRAEYQRFQEELQTVAYERDNYKREFELKQNLIRKYENDAKEYGETISNLNHQIIQLKHESDRDRDAIARLQSGDISLERFEKSQEYIQELKSEISQLKQEKFSQQDQINDLQQRNNEIDLEIYQLTSKLKQFKQIFEQLQQNEGQIILNEHLFDTKSIEQDIQKSSEHIRDLQTEITEKTNRIKQLETLNKQEQIRCREFETKLKVILELRERDAQLHIRQLGQTDAELRKARTDADRVRILQQQFELKQQQLDDVQKVLLNEQTKFNEECTKLQHEIHEKWMEVKRLTRELDGLKKECENYRKQITKYASRERSFQDKSLVKPIAQHLGESETNNSSPIGYQYGENFRSIDQQRNDSGAASPSDMFIPRPPMFPLHRPPFFPPPPPTHPNAFIMHPRFPIPIPRTIGIMSPTPPLMVNNNDGNQSGLLDTSNDLNGSSAADSSYKENIDEKKLKSKKSKKKTRTSVVKEEV